MSKRLLLPLLSATIIIGGTLVAIQFAKGYRPNIKNISLSGTGLLVANSFPKGAQVFIDSKLTTATDDTLNLPPKDYDIEIKKDGYTSWKKHLTLKEELVTQTNATLFPAVPTLKPLTFTGAKSPTPSPDGTKIVYLVENASTGAKNGVWIIDLSERTFTLDRAPRQITRMLWPARQSLGEGGSPSLPHLTDNQPRLTGNQPRLTWSPDSHDILLSIDSSNYLLDTTKFNDPSNLNDVSARLPVIFSEWEEILYRNEISRLKLLPEKMQEIATSSAVNRYFAPDEEKLLYTAIEDITIPQKLLPDLPSENTQPEERELKTGVTYIYDLKEDKNFRALDAPPAELGQEIPRKVSLIEATSSGLLRHNKLKTITDFNAHYSPLSLQSIQWFPTSSHVIITQDGKITIAEYDSANQAIIYANTFTGNFVFPSPTGSQLVILTNLNQAPNGDLTTPPNLYSLNLK